MRTIAYLIQKEFLQIFRNKAMLPLIFLMPVIQLLVLGNAATYDIKNISLHVIDHDGSQASHRLVSKFEASPWFIIVNTSYSSEIGQADLADHSADLVLEIPGGFERELIVESQSGLHLTVDAINGSKAAVAFNYANAIILDYNNQIRAEWMPQFSSFPNSSRPSQINISYLNWFNPALNFKTFMVPGILVLLVTMIGIFLSGMNIVREKELGTIEQLNVTPIKKHQFIIGKLLPFWILGLFELAFGLVVGVLAFNIPIVGSLPLIFGFAALFLLVVLGMGLLISTFTETQQQAMFIAWFFMVIFILMSGLFTPIESMPDWAQKITWFNPIAYFVKVIRMVLLKGSEGWQITHSIGVMVIYAIVINALAIWNYNKRA